MAGRRVKYQIWLQVLFLSPNPVCE